MKEQGNPNDPLSLRKFPFALPDQFVARLGMFWQSAGDELTVYDREHIWTGLHNHAIYQELTRQPQVRGWLNEFLIDLGSSQYPESHHLIVDKERNEAFVAPRWTARTIVRRGTIAEGETSG